MHTKTLECYTYEELSDEAKKNALEKHREINVDAEWWEDDWFIEKAKEYGFIAEMKDLCFSIHSGFAYFYELDLDDTFWQKYINHLVCYKTDPDILSDILLLMDDMTISIGSRNDSSEVGISFYGDDMNADVLYEKLSDKFNLPESIENYIDDLNQEILKSLRKQEEYLYSDEAVADTLIANEFEFDVDGNDL